MRLLSLVLNGRGEVVSKLETGPRSRDFPHLSERSPYYSFLMMPYIYIVAFFLKNATPKKNNFLKFFARRGAEHKNNALPQHRSISQLQVSGLSG
jgi:hypothetical protein